MQFWEGVAGDRRDKVPKDYPDIGAEGGAADEIELVVQAEESTNVVKWGSVTNGSFISNERS